MTADIIDFRKALKANRPPPVHDVIAAVLESTAAAIRSGHFAPDAMFIAFQIDNPDGPGILYPATDMAVSPKMATDLAAHLLTLR